MDMMNTSWNPDLYLKFKKERTQPAIDLVNRIEIDNPGRIVDIGCGPGNSTDVLRSKWSNAKIVGIDSSPQMIKKAKKNYPDGHWQVCDAREMKNYGEFDLVFSNAALQWIPDHEKLIPHLLALAAPTGVLAVQLPQNQFSTLHKSLYRIADLDEFRHYTQASKTILNYQTSEYYYNLISGLVKKLYMWETTYLHILESHADLVNWYKSTGMRPFLENLPNEELKNRMLEKLLAECKEKYKLQEDGSVIFPFKRIFFIGYKNDMFPSHRLC